MAGPGSPCACGAVGVIHFQGCPKADGRPGAIGNGPRTVGAMAGPGNQNCACDHFTGDTVDRSKCPIHWHDDLSVQVARVVPNRCGCDESISLYKSIQEMAAIGARYQAEVQTVQGALLLAVDNNLKLEAEKARLLEDLVDCERKLAKMTQERDDHRRAGEHVTRQFIQATGREPK